MSTSPPPPPTTTAMDDNEDAVAIDRQASPTPPLDPVTCTVCRAADWKYKCPGCAHKSCSLACVKRHKAGTSCTGKASDSFKANVVALEQLDEAVMAHDMHFLEKGHTLLGRDGPIAAAERQMDALADRARGGADAASTLDAKPDDGAQATGGDGDGSVTVYAHAGTPVGARRQLAHMMRERNQPFTQTDGSAKAAANLSTLEFHSNTIMWTVGLAFLDADTTLVCHRVPETLRPLTLLRQFVNKPKRVNALQLSGDYSEETMTRVYKAVGMDAVLVFVKCGVDGDGRQLHHRIDVTTPLAAALTACVIVEYPELVVVVPDSPHLAALTVVDDAQRTTLRDEWAATMNNKRPYVDYDRPQQHRRGGGRGRGGRGRGGGDNRGRGGGDNRGRGGGRGRGSNQRGGYGPPQGGMWRGPPPHMMMYPGAPPPHVMMMMQQRGGRGRGRGGPHGPPMMMYPPMMEDGGYGYGGAPPPRGMQQHLVEHGMVDTRGADRSLDDNHVDQTSAGSPSSPPDLSALPPLERTTAAVDAVMPSPKRQKTADGNTMAKAVDTGAQIESTQPPAERDFFALNTTTTADE